MKIKNFNLETCTLTTDRLCQEQTFLIPTLPAYAVDFANLIINGISNAIDQNTIAIRDKNLVWKISPESYEIDSSDKCYLEVHYHGIRDYSLLFPHVQTIEPDRAAHLGLYYSEMEASFDNAAWLSFMLMAGAIFEHLLFFATGGAKQTLFDLNNESLIRGIISQSDFYVIDKSREYRNVIHANKINKYYVQRKDAMDARSLIERLILNL